MRILVTGGAGYVGSHTVEHLEQLGHDVWVYDDLSAGHRAACRAERLTVATLHDTDRLRQLLHEQRIEAVVHFAALAQVGESVREPARYYSVNLGGTQSLLDAMHAARVRRIVFSSTCAIYGPPERVPIIEEEPPKPISPYGRTKFAVEGMLADYAAAYGFAAVALRYFNAAGASPSGRLGEDHDPETHLIPLVIAAAAGRLPHVSIFGNDYPTPDGTCIRDYVHVCDLASAHAAALERAQPGQLLAYNLGTGRGQSVREVIRTVEEVTGLRVPVVVGARRPGDPPELVAAPDRAAAELGWRARYLDLRETVATAWQWHRSHPHGYGEPAG